MTTTTTRCLLNDNVGLETTVCVSLLTQTEWARWVYHGHNGGGGKVKKAEEQSPFRYLCESEQGRRRLELACSLRPGTVLSRKVVGETAHSPLHYDSPVRPQRKQSVDKSTHQCGKV